MLHNQIENNIESIDIIYILRLRNIWHDFELVTIFTKEFNININCKQVLVSGITFFLYNFMIDLEK